MRTPTLPRLPGLAFLLVFGILLSSPLFADLRNEAITAELEGHLAAAIRLYGDWIEGHPGHRDGFDVLEHAAGLHDRPLDALAFLDEHVRYLEPEAAARTYARMASLESSLGLPGDAARHYALAAEYDGPNSSRWALEGAVLRFAIGDVAGARSIARVLVLTARDGLVRDESAALAALSRSVLGDSQGALEDIETHLRSHSDIASPLVHLAHRHIALELGDSGTARKAEERLAEDFPRSAVDYLSRGRILEWVSPGVLIRRQTTRPTGAVQVGAFRERDRAAALRDRLEGDGFTAWFESSDGLWRVLVNDPDGEAGSRLAAKGYTGLLRR